MDDKKQDSRPHFSYPAPWTEAESQERGEMYAFLNTLLHRGILTRDELQQVFLSARSSGPRSAWCELHEIVELHELVERLRCLREHQLSSLEDNFFGDDHNWVAGVRI